MVQIEGTYKRTSVENYDAFLAKTGMGMMLRKAATMAAPTLEISIDSEGKYRMVTSTAMTKMELIFELGVEFESKLPGGGTSKGIMTKEGEDKLIFKQSGNEGKNEVTVIRHFSDEGIDQQNICGDVVAKQYFTRQ